MDEHTVSQRLDAPYDWPALDTSVRDRAVAQALEALSGESRAGAVRRLVSYYAVEGDYAGASFATLPPVGPTTITATDLHATSLLSVEVGPGATRRLLEPTPDRERALEVLSNLRENDLADAGAETLTSMDEFYRWVKGTLSSPSAKDPNPWVTASKLCARKRPRLFPVRDRNVCAFLGVLKLKDFRLDWLVFRELVRSPDVARELTRLPDRVQAAAGERAVVIDESPLRLLDAALWTHTVWAD
jgi:hypothetical protein